MDHFGGLLGALEALGDRFTGELYYNHDSLLAMPVVDDAERSVAGKRVRALLNRARQYGERLRAAVPASAPIALGSISIEILSPAQYELNQAISTSNPNLASAVVVLRAEGQSIVVGADAQISIWERIAEELPKGALVRWPHHRGLIGLAGSHSRLMELLEPSDVFVSVNNPHGHPSIEFCSAAQGALVSFRCTQATKVCAAGGGQLGPCAGTIRIELSSAKGTAISTEIVDHHSRVDSLQSAQCRE
jgi:hypothetical protein